MRVFINYFLLLLLLSRRSVKLPQHHGKMRSHFAVRNFKNMLLILSWMLPCIHEDNSTEFILTKSFSLLQLPATKIKWIIKTHKEDIFNITTSFILSWQAFFHIFYAGAFILKLTIKKINLKKQIPPGMFSVLGLGWAVVLVPAISDRNVICLLFLLLVVDRAVCSRNFATVKESQEPAANAPVSDCDCENIASERWMPITAKEKCPAYSILLWREKVEKVERRSGNQ